MLWFLISCLCWLRLSHRLVTIRCVIAAPWADLIANFDPAADLPAALLGLQAVINTQDRQIPADDFFHDLFETALAADDILVSVDLRGAAT